MVKPSEHRSCGGRRGEHACQLRELDRVVESLTTVRCFGIQSDYVSTINLLTELKAVLNKKGEVQKKPYARLSRAKKRGLINPLN